MISEHQNAFTRCPLRFKATSPTITWALGQSIIEHSLGYSAHCSPNHCLSIRVSNNQQYMRISENQVFEQNLRGYYLLQLGNWHWIVWAIDWLIDIWDASSGRASWIVWWAIPIWSMCSGWINQLEGSILILLSKSIHLSVKKNFNIISYD